VKFRDDQILRAFALQMKKIRSEKNITQEELVYTSGLSLSQIARVETAKVNPTLCTVFVIARYLEVSPKELVDFDGD
jgi:predicted transcriptional regulator